jgi:hypothetical protein
MHSYSGTNCLIERKAVTKDIKAIGHISDIPVQHRVMALIRDEKELKQLYANTSNSFDRTASVLKGKSLDLSTLYKKSESLTFCSLSFASFSGIFRGTITLSTTCTSPINVLKVLH